MEREFIRIKVAVMLVADAPSTLDEATGALVVDKLTTAGHEVWPTLVVKDSEAAVRKQIDSWIDFSDVDVIIAISGFETDATTAALAPLITKQLTGFSDLFRLLTYREIGTAAMLTEVIAAQCGHTFVFALPAARGAVATALEKLLIPQLDCRTRPRNLVMRMPRHKSKVPTTGPMSFANEETPAGVPPPPRSAKTMPPPLPKRSAATYTTPPMPMPIVAVAAPAVSRTISDSNITDLAMIEEAAPATGSLEDAIERSIEATGKALEETKEAKPQAQLDDNDPAVVAAREHAEKTPAAQAAAWVAAVEEAASKTIKRTVAERVEREARRSGEHKIPEPETVATEEATVETPDIQADESAPEPEAKVEIKLDAGDEPRGKIEKATGAKAATRPDRPVDHVAAVIVDDPDLVDKRSKAASMQPPTKKAAAVEPTDLPVFAQQATPAPAKQNRSWLIIAMIALIGAVILLVNVVGKRGTDPEPKDASTPTVKLDPAPVEPPPVLPTGNGGRLAMPDAADPDIEMDPTNVRMPRTVPRPPKDADPDDPDLTKAPTNPSLTEECDEVSCVLTKYDRPCCEKFRPLAPPPVVPVVPVDPSAGPVELDKTLIRVGVERLRALVIACGEQVKTKGKVALSVTVKPDGNVASVAVSETPDAALGECAATVMRKAAFAKTQNGGTFTYPFVF